MDLRVQSLFGQLSLLSLELTTSCTSSSNNSDSNKSTEPLGQHSCRGTKPEAAAENSIFPTHISCSWASHQPGGAADLSSLCSAQKKCQRAKRKNKINLLEVNFSPSSVHLPLTRNRSGFRCFFLSWFTTRITCFLKPY